MRESKRQVSFEFCEIFCSIQGEGLTQGMPSVFLRLPRCNLHCLWCDTQDLLRKGEITRYNIRELLDIIALRRCSHVVITGGEPALEEHLPDLVNALRAEGYFVTVETNATLIREFHCDLFSMSPKLSNSIGTLSDGRKFADTVNIEAIRYYMELGSYQMKFVARDMQSDFDEIRHVLEQLGPYDPQRVMIMPLAATREELVRIQRNMVRLCMKNGLRYANRLQLQIWDEEPET